MDVGRLLKTANDIGSDEEGLAIQSCFQKILNAYNEGKSEVVETERATLKEALGNSMLTNYVRSDYEILFALEAGQYFGDGSLAKLNEILHGAPHLVKVELGTFVQKRQELLNKLKTLRNSLDAFNIETRELDDEHYQFGFSLPDSYKDFVSVNKVLEDVRLLLAAVADAVDESKEFKIAYTSSSELQFFIDISQRLADYTAMIIDCALRIYGTYSMYKDLKEKMMGLSGERKKEALRIAEEDKLERAKDFADELIKDLKIEEHDDQNRVRMLFARFLKHMEDGVGVEIRTPSITPPDEPTEDASSQQLANYKEIKRGYDRKIEIDLKNKEIHMLQINNFNGVKLEFLEEVLKGQVTTLKSKKSNRKSGRKRPSQKSE